MAASKVLDHHKVTLERDFYNTVDEEKDYKTHETDKMCSKVLTRGRKIAPDTADQLPENNAWQKEESLNISSDSFLKINIEETNVLIPSAPILIDREMSTPYGCRHHRKDYSKYVNVAENGVGNGHIKYNGHCGNLLGHPHMKSVLHDDDSISLDIIRNVQSRKNSKNHYLKYFCPPYFILLASILEIAVFVWDDNSLDRILMYSPHNREQVWRFMTYMLVHSGSVHLTLNIIIQTMLATPLEFEQGWWRCCVVYIGGGLIGALGASLFQPTLYMVGASAGVYALLTSHLANVLLRFSTLHYRIFRIFAVAVLASSDVAFSIAHGQIAGTGTPKIGWASHCAGAAAGLMLGILFYTGSDSGRIYIKVLKYTSLISILIIIIMSVLGNIFFIRMT